MIDCPICHVKNENDARFCAECGQRLTPGGQSSAPSGQPQAPGPLPPAPNQGMGQQQPFPQQAPTPPDPRQISPQQIDPRQISPQQINPQQMSPQGQQISPQQQQIPPQQQGQQPGQQRLHSPLLSNAGNEAPAPEQPQRPGSGGDMSRLRQLSARNADKPDNPNPMAELPFKNPYDPRNQMPDQPQQPMQQQPMQQQPMQQPMQQQPMQHPMGQPMQQQPVQQQPAPQQPPEAPRRKGGLRSPLLAGEEFDEDEYEAQDNSSPQVRSGKMHSPLLGGGGGGGGDSHGKGLRSPLLGGGGGGGAPSDYDDDYDSQIQSGGTLRSPLLGGGGGYGGPDRRRNEPEQPYGGSERRRGGLRSPILGSGSDYEDDYYEEEDDPYADEENPNVLRSPLLAAKRPLADRPSKSPANSNIQNRAPDAAQVHYPQGNPSSSYNSLRSISSVTGGQNVPNVPPVPAQGPLAAPTGLGGPGMHAPAPGGPGMPAPGQPGLGARPQDMNQLYGQPSVQPAPQNPAAPAAPGFPGLTGGYEQVPPGFHVEPSGGPLGLKADSGRTKAIPDPTPQPVMEPKPEPHVSPPTSFPAEMAKEIPPMPLQQQQKVRSRMFGGPSEEDEPDTAYSAPPSNRFSAPAVSEGGQPLLKIVGIVALVLVLGKLVALLGFMNSEWFKFMPFVIDQLVSLLAMIVLAVVCFLASKR